MRNEKKNEEDGVFALWRIDSEGDKDKVYL